MRILPAATFLLLAALASVRGQLDEVDGLNGLQEVELSQLSQQDTNPLGRKALAMHPEQWKHAETAHFIYHFVKGFVASRVAVEAEFHFRVVARQLEKEEPANNRKSHIYIFERDEDWAEFRTVGGLEPWTGGIQQEGSLFVPQNPSYKFTGNVLGHEIAHLLLFRYYGRGIPLWLNEGFAQYVSKSARASFQRARGYIAKPRSDAIAPKELLPIALLISYVETPEGLVDLFYDESERLVRFLVMTDKTRFLSLLDAIGKHERFEMAFARVYAGAFVDGKDLEAKFREYASKDYGSTLRDLTVN